MKNFQNELKEVLKPLYKKLLNEVTFEDICTFCVQWGPKFPKENNTGLLFIGKAVNGWVNDETDVDVLFGDSDNRVFDRKDQMVWVNNAEGGESYNTKKSAFWRVVKRISAKYYPEDWYTNIAWSNLCKIAPFSQGNPSDKLYYEQLESCQQILSREIEILSPKVVIMFTSGWEKDFLNYLNDNNELQSQSTIEWDGYKTQLYVIKGTKFIVSQHPQGKAEDKHVDAILNLID